MGCYGGPHMRRIIHLASGGVCWSRVGPGGEPQSAKVRRFAYHACFPVVNITRGLPEVERFRDSEIPEILGPLDPSACDFINQIGSRMSAITGDRRETAF